MSDEKKDAELMRALLVMCEGLEPSDSELDEELRAEGIDVAAFLSQVDQRVQEVKEYERLSRLRAARSKLAARGSRHRLGTYQGLGHDGLVAEYLRRQHAKPELLAFHRNFEKMTDDDLRSLLEDQDQLGEE